MTDGPVDDDLDPIDPAEDIDGFDVFERLGRAAGAELRALAPPDGAARVVSAATARRRRRRVASTSALALLVVTGALALATRHGDVTDPTDRPPVLETTVPPSPTTSAPGVAGRRDTTVRDGENWIVYEAATGRRDALFLVRPDGTGLHELAPTATGGNQEKAFWSPDGEALVFVMPESIGPALWTIAADGSNPQRLLACDSPCISLDDPTWSPNGSAIAYTRMIDADGAALSTLERIDVRTGAVEVLLSADPLDFYAGARWSPTGDQIVLEVVHRASSGGDAEVIGVDLALVDVGPGATSTIRTLTEATEWAVTPDWSPDGDAIVYAAPPDQGSAESDLFVISPTGGPPTRLTFLADGARAASYPSFDDTGERLLFTLTPADGGGYTIASIRRDGGGLEPTLGSASIPGTHARARP